MSYTLLITALVCLALLFVTQTTSTAFRYSFTYRKPTEDHQNVAEKVIADTYKHPGRFLLNTSAMSLLLFAIITTCFVAALLPIVTTPWATVLPCVCIIVSLLVGIVLPKTIAGRRADNALRVLIMPVSLLLRIFSPLLYIIAALAHIASRMLSPTSRQHILSYAFGGSGLMNPDLRPAISAKQTAMRENDMEIFRNALEFSKVRVRDCIVPRTEIRAIEASDGYDDLIENFTASGKSKIIIYEEDLDHIIGYVHSSDIFSLPSRSDWKQCIREIPIVPEAMSAHKMMQIFMQQKKSIAVVADEFGGTSGIISLEDLVEEIFGDIEDEHDVDTLTARTIGENEYILSARLEIEKVNEKYGLHLPESDDYLTIGGLILFHYQDFPKMGQTVNIGNFQFRILKVSTAKIELVKLKVEL